MTNSADNAIDLSTLEGQLAVITGGASGIGYALAKKCAEHGMHVLLADVEAQALEEALVTLRQGGASAEGEVVDVADRSRVEGLAERAFASGRVVRLLFNNAGIGILRPFLETSDEDWQWTLDVNLWGVIHGMRAFLPRMIEAGDQARVVNTASAAGLLSPTGLSAYNVTKHGVVTLTETVHGELVADGADTRLHVLCPDLVKTRIHQSERNRPDGMVAEGDDAESLGLLNQALEEPMQDALSPDELAATVFRALASGTFTIMTHDKTRGEHAERSERIQAGDPPPEAALLPLDQ